MSSRPIDAGYRLAYRAGFRLARLWWRLRRPRHEGVVVGVWVGEQVVLVRQSYRRLWTLPGGGRRAGETPAEGAARELGEELGLIVAAADLEPAGTVEGAWDHRREHVHLFTLRWHGAFHPRLDYREIVEARLLDPDAARALPLTGPAHGYLSGSHGHRAS